MPETMPLISVEFKDWAYELWRKKEIDQRTVETEAASWIKAAFDEIESLSKQWPRDEPEALVNAVSSLKRKWFGWTNPDDA